MLDRRCDYDFSRISQISIWEISFSLSDWKFPVIRIFAFQRFSFSGRTFPFNDIVGILVFIKSLYISTPSNFLVFIKSVPVEKFLFGMEKFEILFRKFLPQIPFFCLVNISDLSNSCHTRNSPSKFSLSSFIHLFLPRVFLASRILVAP